MLKLKLQYFGHPVQRADSLGKHPDAGKTECRDERLECTTNSMDMSLSKLWEIVKDRVAKHAVITGLHRVGHDLATEQ